MIRRSVSAAERLTAEFCVDGSCRSGNLAVAATIQWAALHNAITAMRSSCTIMRSDSTKRGLGVRTSICTSDVLSIVAYAERQVKHGVSMVYEDNVGRSSVIAARSSGSGHEVSRLGSSRTKEDTETCFHLGLSSSPLRTKFAAPVSILSDER